MPPNYNGFGYISYTKLRFSYIDLGQTIYVCNFFTFVHEAILKIKVNSISALISNICAPYNMDHIVSPKKETSLIYIYSMLCGNPLCLHAQVGRFTSFIADGLESFSAGNWARRAILLLKVTTRVIKTVYMCCVRPKRSDRKPRAYAFLFPWRSRPSQLITFMEQLGHILAPTREHQQPRGGSISQEILGLCGGAFDCAPPASRAKLHKGDPIRERRLICSQFFPPAGVESR